MTASSEPTAHDEQLHAVIAEYHRQLDRGEALDRAAFIAAHGEFQAELESYFQSVDSVERLAGPALQTAHAGDAVEATMLTQPGQTIEQSVASPASGHTPTDSAVKPDTQSVVSGETIITMQDEGTASAILGLSGSQTSAPLQRFGRYRIVRELGRGAMGAVYLAHDEQLDREVALKIPQFGQDLNRGLLERFYREARAAAALRHPGICPVYDVGEIDGQHYITMAYIKGRALRDFTKSSRRQEGRQVARVIRKIALAMAEAHEHNVIHRDLKPANVMIDPKNEPVVMDFGLARRATEGEERLTHTGTIIGTPAYMSPEQVDGDNDNVGARSDIYSLGVIFYELLTGQLPFQGNLMSILRQIATADPRPPAELFPDIDPALQSLCLKMLAKKAANRPESMTAVAQSLTDWLSGRHAATDESGLLETSRAPGQSRTHAAEVTEPMTPTGLDRAEPAGEEFPSAREMSATRQRPRSATRREGPPTSRRWLLAGGLGGAAFLLAGIVFLLKLGKHDVQITLDDPAMSLKVDGDAVIIEGSGSPIRLSAGPHELHVELAGFESEVSQFTVKKDGKNAVHVAILDGKLAIIPDGKAPTISRTELPAPGSSDTASSKLPSSKAEHVALAFDGVDDHVILPTLPWNGRALTIEALVQAGAQAFPNGMVIAMNSERGLALLSFDTDGVPVFGRMEKETLQSTLDAASREVAQTRPVHIAAVHDGETTTLFLNGRSIARGVTTTYTPRGRYEPQTTIGAILQGAGAEKTPMNFLKGVIHDIRVSSDARYTRDFDPTAAFNADAETIALYHIDEGTGDVLRDSSGHNRHGRIVGAKWVKADNTPPAQKRFDLALEFDGVSSHITVPTWKYRGDHPLTAEAWVRWAGPRSEKELQTILGDPEQSGMTMFYSEGHWSFSVNDGKFAHAIQDKPVPQDQWVHMAGVFDGKSEVRLYVNGVLQSRAHITNPYRASRMPFTIGANPNQNGKIIDYFRGEISRVRISRAEIYKSDFTPEAHFNPDHDTVALYQFDEGVGDVLKDSSGNNHDGRIVGAKWVRLTDDATSEPTDKPASAPPLAVAPFNEAQARAHQEAWAKHLDLPVEYTNSIGMKFRLIPPGEFTMGSTPAEIDAALVERGDKHWEDCVQSEAPRHKVILTQPIYLGVNEVTQTEYEQVMGKTPSDYSPTGRSKQAVVGLDTKKHPVEAVNWIDAADFCAKLSQRENLKPFYFRGGSTITPLDGTGYRLPTEAEWEFACRAGTISRFWSGDEDQDLAQAGWFQKNSGGRTHAVGELKDNPFGLYDIHGNVWEWVQDTWNATWYEQFRESSAINPVSPFDSAASHVVRGGSRSQSASNTRSSHRYARSPSALGPEFGFRVSLPIDAVRQQLAQKEGTPPKTAIAPFDAQQARAHQEAWARHLGTTVETTNSVGAKMILIPPGEFLMGSTDEQVAAALKAADGFGADPSTKDRILKSERPQHKVVITKPFLMGATEVTIGQFKKFTASGYRTEEEFRATKDRQFGIYLNPDYAVSDDSPVTVVTWKDAQAYCQWLSGQEQTTYRLPTEAEWEYACRAGTTTHYSFGDDYTQLDQYGWYDKNVGGKSHPVGIKLPNGFGLHDMHGNVLELCHDFYDEKWYQDAPSNNPSGPTSGVFRSHRGGNWCNNASVCRSAYRSAASLSYRTNFIGFRVVRVLDTQATATSMTPTSPPVIAPPPVTKPVGPQPPPAKAPFDAAQARAHQEAWAKHLGTTVETTNSVGQKMVLIPPGEFLMGSTDEQVAAALKLAAEEQAPQSAKERIPNVERPPHRVKIDKSFLMGATEITIGQFKRFAASAGYQTAAEQAGENPQQTYTNPGYAVTDESPATYISLHDAVAYCRWLSDQEQVVYRLPWEAEWEYACRAGTTTQYSFGDDHHLLEQFGWYRKNARGTPRPVGTLLPNPFGLQDMHGNVWEWCQDTWDEKRYEKATSDRTANKAIDSDRVIRGGDNTWFALYCRSAYSHFNPTSVGHRFLGFRIVREISAPTTAASVSRVTDPERRVAEWVVAKGGTVGVTSAKLSRKGISRLEDLPAGPLVVTGISMTSARGITPEEWKSLVNLRALGSLNLINCSVDDAALASIGRLELLRFLRVVNDPKNEEVARITDAGIRHQANLQRLEFLEIQNTSMTAQSLESLGKLTRLNALAIGANPKLAVESLAALRGLTRVDTLGLNSIPLQDAALTDLRLLPRVRSLNIGRTDVTDAGLTHLNACRELRWLSLGYNSVTAAGMSKLAEHPSVAVINLRDTKIPPAELPALADQFPRTMLVHPALKSRYTAELEANAWIKSVGGTISASYADGLEPSGFFHAGFRATFEKTIPAPQELRHLAEIKFLSVLQFPNSANPDSTIRLAVESLNDHPTLNQYESTELPSPETMRELARHTALTSLICMGYNAPTRPDESLKLLPSLPRLQTVRLNSPQITHQVWSYLAQLRELHVLDLKSSELTGQGLGELRVLPELHTLTLPALKLAPADLTPLAVFPDLTYLQLDGSTLDDAGLAQLTGCRTLRFLEARGTQVTAAGVAQLQQALPNCTVFWDGLLNAPPLTRVPFNAR